MVIWWALRKLRKEKNTCHQAALRLQPLPAVSPRGLQMWKHGMLVPESWGAYQMNDFSEPRLLHIPKHRKVLNSWDMWFSLINKNLLIDVQTTCPLLPNFYMTWLLVSPFQSSSLRVNLRCWSWSFRAWNPKKSHQIKHNSQLLGCEYFWSLRYLSSVSFPSSE